MNYNNVNKNNSTVFIRLMCAIVFALSTWSYLYFFQADVIAVAQHVLSHGRTDYNRIIGSLIITVILLGIQQLVYAVSRLKHRLHALTYLPSAVLLAMMTDISSDIDCRQSFLGWYIAYPVLLMLSGLAVCVAVRLQRTCYNVQEHMLWRTLWVSMMLIFLMLVGVCGLANTNAVFHYRAKAETCLFENDYDGALETGIKSLETDSCLTMIRAFALACNGELGNRMFTYPINCSGNALVPMPIDSASLAECKITTTRFMRYPLRRLYMKLGACPATAMRAMDYLRQLERCGKATPLVRDYILTVSLVDRNLDAFAEDMRRYYANIDIVGDSLPRHYREALTLYRHLRTKPVVQYHNTVMEADYQDFQKLLRKYEKESERKLNAYEYYFGSYWYYYEFK